MKILVGKKKVEVDEKDLPSFLATMRAKNQPKPDGAKEAIADLSQSLLQSNLQLAATIADSIKKIKIPKPADVTMPAKPDLMESEVEIIRDWRNQMTGFKIKHRYSDGTVTEQ